MGEEDPALSSQLDTASGTCLLGSNIAVWSTEPAWLDCPVFCGCVVGCEIQAHRQTVRRTGTIPNGPNPSEGTPTAYHGDLASDLFRDHR